MRVSFRTAQQRPDSTGLGTIAADATPGLSIADAVNVAEGRDAVFRVTLRPATNHVVSVTYTTMDGTAKPPTARSTSRGV